MIAQLVNQLYAALAAGDRSGVEGLLAPDFHAKFSAGLPEPIGGVHSGADAIDSGWWEIGRRFRGLRAVPEEQIETVDGRLLVLGRYLPVDAAFAHIWSATGDRLTSLVQITDTALWLAEPKVGQPATH
jgi:2-(1,2-epoxy-1,2-dihydrophenyl)acetyl-CoA isomerase